MNQSFFKSAREAFEYFPLFGLHLFLSDFEMALQTSLFKIIKQKYEIDIEIKGCWFHFNQALVRKMI